MDTLKEMRETLMSDMIDINPKFFERASRNRALNALLPSDEFKPTIKNLKEELLMENNLRMPPVPPTGGNMPPAPPTVNAPATAQPAGGTGISTKIGLETLKLALETSTRFRPKAIIIDKDVAERMVVDMTSPDIQRSVEIFENDPKNLVEKADGSVRLKKYSDLRALKDTCLRTEKPPLTFAKKNPDGSIMTKPHKPVVQGLVITFPATEGQGEVTSIIKKADFYNEIASRGGATLVGSITESELDKSKYEIPVVLQVKPYPKKAKDGTTTSADRLTGQISFERKKQWFPEDNVVSLLKMFSIYPTEGYELGRVIPRRIHKTEAVGNQNIAIISIDFNKDKNKPNSLPKYVVEDNPLAEGYPGADICKALGIDSATIDAAFTSRKAGGSITEVSTTEELIDAVMEDYRKNMKLPEYNKLLATLEQHQKFQ